MIGCRKIFLAALSIMILFLVTPGCERKMPQRQNITIGVINLTPVLEPVYDGFKEGMAEWGYVEGRNVTYIYQGPTGSIEGLAPAIAKLIKSKVDLIFSLSTPATMEAKKAVEMTDIPVVFAPVSDPVKAGVVESLRAPGGNLTGVKVGGFTAKGLEWLQAIDPSIKQIFVPHNPQDRSSVLELVILREAATKLGINIILKNVNTSEEIKELASDIPDGADAIMMLPDNLILSQIHSLAQAAREHEIPITAVSRTTTEAGALMAYGPEFFLIGKQASRLADQVLKGIEPAHLPVETADSFLTVNLKTAKAINIEIPDEILLQAKTIIR